MLVWQVSGHKCSISSASEAVLSLLAVHGSEYCLRTWAEFDTAAAYAAKEGRRALSV